MSRKFVHILAARPNFVKAAPVIKEMINQKIEFEVVHTGQHYDSIMSDSFLTLLGIPTPDLNLGVNGGGHGYQVGSTLIKLEEYFLKSNPKAVVVYGDVNATVAAALAAVKLNIPVVHIESGCRSYDRSMPEEINRVLTDSISSTLFTTSLDCSDNLKKEGISEHRVFFVGNTMIDSLVSNLDKLEDFNIFSKLGIEKESYVLCTFHRPSNVDTYDSLCNLLEIFKPISNHYKCILPIHPRTKTNIIKYNLLTEFEEVFTIIPPCTYFDFLTLQKYAYCIITDSGGVQEEASFFNKPCFTLRNNTERPVTVTKGTNHLVGEKPENLLTLIQSKNNLQPKSIDFWDGKAAIRLVTKLKELYE